MLSETSSSILHISISVLRSQRLPVKKMKNPPCWTEASSSHSANKEQARFTPAQTHCVFGQSLPRYKIYLAPGKVTIPTTCAGRETRRLASQTPACVARGDNLDCTPQGTVVCSVLSTACSAHPGGPVCTHTSSSQG